VTGLRDPAGPDLVVGSVVLLSTGAFAPAGALTAAAWDLLRGGADVCVGRSDHPLLEPLAEAGVRVTVLAHGPAGPGGPGPGSVAARLGERASATGARVVYLLDPAGEPAGSADLAAALETAGLGVDTLVGSWDPPGAAMLAAAAVMDRLRSPGGCPWDAAQTHRSLLPYLLEEAYEAVEAVETDDLVGLREEMGDLLLQVVFHARLGEEHPEEPWSVDDVAAGIVDKLVSRHPHVFGGAAADTPEQVEQSWEELKRAEKGRSSVVEGVPLAQPALALAAALVERADRAGLAVPVDAVPVDAVPVDAVPVDAAERALGSVLLALAADAVRSGADPEAALRAAARSYAERVRAAEAEAGR
jgi:XTP/dITP diphosphohydrolase